MNIRNWLKTDPFVILKLATIFWTLVLIAIAPFLPFVIYVLIYLFLITLTALLSSIFSIIRKASVARISIYGLLMLIYFGLFIWYSIPRKIIFQISKSSLNELADKMEKEENVEFPQWAGVIKVQKGEVDSSLSDKKITCLWTILESSGNTGFVQLKNTRNIALFSYEYLDKEWSYIEIE